MKFYAKKNKIILAALALILSHQASAGVRCESVFTSLKNFSTEVSAKEVSYEKAIVLDAEGRAFAKGADKVAGKEIQFGFESEYTINELAPFTNYYGPTPESGISKHAWLAMPVENRMAWIKEKLKSIPFGAKDAVLVLMESSPELSFLPSKLIRDDTGNVEIILAPVSSFSVWKNQMQWINKNFGVGSMQAMVSQPRESFFGKEGALKEVAQKENEGYFNFIHEADVLERMASGAEKYSQDSTKEVMRPFLHPYLGPMIRYRHKKMINTMREVADGKVLTPEDIEIIIRREQSFKYIGSTAYRPDIGGPARASQEIRDAHKDEALLVEHTARAVFYAQKGRSAFIPMANMKPFDSQKVFEGLSANIQTMLKTIFPVKAPAQVQAFENALFVHETYRNFGFPLKDWKSTLQALDRLDLLDTVSHAQTNYLAKLQKIAEDLTTGKITVEMARSATQGALARFAVESRLHEAFVMFQEAVPKKVTDVYNGLVVSRRSFELRLAMFKNNWKNNVTVVPGVRFKYRDEHQKSVSYRDILMISTEGLSPAEISRLEKDYLDVVTIQTLTFPLKERATHTLVQFDGTVYNFGYFPIQMFSKFRKGDYAASSSRRLEPMVMLTRTEEIKMAQYIANIKANKKAVLGKFMLEGDPTNNGKLTDNRSQCGNNCTTWITSAPIGSSGESLVWLLGGERTVPWIQQNPGWFGSWMVGTASQERVPMIAYWTKNSLEKAQQTEIVDNSLVWDFNKK